MTEIVIGENAQEILRTLQEAKAKKERALISFARILAILNGISADEWDASKWTLSIDEAKFTRIPDATE